MAEEMSKSDKRKKFGLEGQPIKATRVLAVEMPHFTAQGIDGKSLIIINDQAGTFQSAQVYDGHLGKNYSSEGLVHPLPASGSDKWKEWTKKGYEFKPVGDFDVLEDISTPAEEQTEDSLEEETADEA